MIMNVAPYTSFEHLICDIGMQVKKGQREEAVLYDVFPKHVADALVAGRKVCCCNECSIVWCICGGIAAQKSIIFL